MPKLKKKKAKKKVLGGTLLALLSLTFASRALTADDTFRNCNGKERWDVKTLQDQAASEVDYNHIQTATVQSLSQVPRNFNPNKEAEFFRHPEEKKVYHIKNCKIDLVKKALKQHHGVDATDEPIDK